jgi:hypothetical protein
VLNRYPAKYIYEPWMAPIAIQRLSNCLIGVDYPSPIVDHNLKSKENIKNIKKAYEQRKQQDDDQHQDSSPKKEIYTSSSEPTSKKAKIEDYFSQKNNSKKK